MRIAEDGNPGEAIPIEPRPVDRTGARVLAGEVGGVAAAGGAGEAPATTKLPRWPTDDPVAVKEAARLAQEAAERAAGQADEES